MNIDIVIPTFNRLWTVQRVVRSYLKQPQVSRVIVVDDASLDGTKEWLESLQMKESRLVVLRQKKRRGACAARNIGIQKAKSPFVFFTDDDMLLYPENALSLLLDDLIRRNADIIAPFLTFPEGDHPQELSYRNIPIADSLYLYYKLTLERKPMRIIIKNIPSNSFKSMQLSGIMLMRHSVLNKVRYDELLGDNSYRDETDFQLKAIEYGFRLFACPKVFLIDLFKSNDRGGCHTMSSLKYEFLCCHNNWLILKRHREVLKHIGINNPIQIMQFCFILEHLFNRLPRKLIFKLFQKLNIINKNFFVLKNDHTQDEP